MIIYYIYIDRIQERTDHKKNPTGTAAAFLHCPGHFLHYSSGMRKWMVLFGALLGVFATAAEDPAPPLKKGAEIPMPGVQGRIDHLALDAKSDRLFVAALGNNSVEVLDLKAGKQINRLSDQAEPQSVLFLADLNAVVISSGEGGRVDILDAQTLDRSFRIEGLADADNMRFDPATRHVYVAYGLGEEAGLAELDPVKGTVVRKIKLHGHPEAFALDPETKRAYVNVPSVREIQVLDLEKAEVAATWPLKDARSNFPMTLDAANHRLLVGCRSPAKVLVFDTERGACVASFDAAGDADDLFFDAQQRRLYQSGGDGTLRVYKQASADRYELEQKVATVAGARTCLYAPDTRALFLAVPKHGEQDAAIWRFDLAGQK